MGTEQRSGQGQGQGFISVLIRVPESSPGADTRGHLGGVDDLEKTRFVLLAEAPGSTQVV